MGRGGAIGNRAAVVLARAVKREMAGDVDLFNGSACLPGKMLLLEPRPTRESARSAGARPTRRVTSALQLALGVGEFLSDA